MVMRMTLASHEALDSRHIELLLDVYAAALHVEATLPHSDLACIAARKIIASFQRDLSASQNLSLATH
jgi:hypothetical protein